MSQASPARPRLLVLMGSGELAPTMVKVHRDVLGRLGGGSSRCVLLETPFAFQENAAELATKARAYFSSSLGADLQPAGLLGAAGQADAMAAERATASIRAADYVFAGPGSPSYALRRWREGVVPQLLAEKLDFGGALCFSSAAALTLGSFTVPVYEIYKVGQDPYWLEGLDLLGRVGLEAAVVPHYDNAEGGTHDTRFCYLGERRLAELESRLPEGTFVLGIDEHTAIVIDVDSGSASVAGLGAVTLRCKGRSQRFPSGSLTCLDELRATARALAAEPLPAPRRASERDAGSEPGPESGAAREPQAAPYRGAAAAGLAGSPLLAVVRSSEASFAAALVAGDAELAVRAALELEQALGEWASDIPQADELERAHASLRSMVLELGERAAATLRDPAAVVAPLVEPLLELRRLAREERRFDVADKVRDLLLAERVELHDTPEGTTWELAPR